MTNNEITKALLILRPYAEFIIRGDGYEAIEWLDKKQNKPTIEEIEAEIANPTLMPEQTVAEKLKSVGLSIDDLKAALGL